MDALKPEDVLKALCDLLLVDVDGLARLFFPGDEKKQWDWLSHHSDLQSTLHTLVRCTGDMSIAGIAEKIVSAAAEPLWRVTGYVSYDGGKQRFFDSVVLRAPNETVAGKVAREIAWDGRVNLPGAGKAQWLFDVMRVNGEEIYVCPGGDKTMRTLNRGDLIDDVKLR